MRSGGCSAGSGRVARLDPYSLPVRFVAKDAAADERVRDVELHRERVVMRRSLAGMRMALNMPVSAFSGIAIRLATGEDGVAPSASVVLEHKDASLALTLFVSNEIDDAFTEWRSWSNVLGLPLLVEDEGILREPFARMGGVLISNVRPRRRRHNAINRRRSTMSLRRKAGKLKPDTPVYRGEHEIVARN